MNKFSVFYTGMFRFPDQDAAGKRVKNVVSALEKIPDCESVIIGGWEKGSQSEEILNEKSRHFSFSILDKVRRFKYQKLFGFLFMGFIVVPWMLKNKKRYSHIVIYNTPFLFTLVCVVLSKLLCKKLVLDSTEWYESNHIVGGKYGAGAFENWCRMRLAYPLVRNVIAISTFLEKFYQKSAEQVVRIPPLSDRYLSAKSEHTHSECDVVLLYAGSPGQKDRLDHFIYQIIKNKKSNKTVKLYIAGITKDNFLAQYPKCNINNSVIDELCVFLGRIPMSEVGELYKKADYCIFFRENKRYAIAGFPSKYVEALSNGVPAITNAIGDIMEDFPDTGIVFEPEAGDIDQLIEMAISEKDNFQQKVKHVFESKYSVDANIHSLQMFFRNAQ